MVGIRDETLRHTRGDFARAVRALAWRGPDGVATTEVGGWHLGVTRLAITDPAAPQPIVCAQTGRVIVFNGAVTSAAVEWERYGEGRTSHNDAELPLLRLRHAGLAHVQPTCGHHAFAVVEPSGAAWFGRDRFGEKPLYTVRAGTRVVAFASTVAALRALGFRVEVGEEQLGSFFARGFMATPDLHDAGLELDDAGSGIWSADDGRVVAQAEAKWPARPLRARLQAAVERCARAEVKVGLALSGGVDSACIAACLAAADRREVLGFQFQARGAAAAERDLAESVAQSLRLPLVPVDGGPELLMHLEPLTRAVGLPLGDPSILAAHAVARAAAQAEVKVLLAGEGGDEMFFGYRRYRAMAWLGWLRWLPAPADLAHGAWARLARAARARAYDPLLAVSPPGVAQRGLVPSLNWPAAAHDEASDGARDLLQQAVARDRDVYLRRDLLPKLDAATMLAGIEGRCPFLDPEVVAADEARLDAARGGLGKRALRAAFAGELPPAVLQQGKTGFGLPLDRWLREDSFLPDLLRDRRTCERPHLVANGLTQLLDLHRSGRRSLGHALYLFAAYEIYLRTREAAACPE